MNIEDKFELNDNIGNKMYQWACDLFPLNRSILGQANRDTLLYIKNIIPELNIKYFFSGEKVFDWIIPDEWQVDEAFIEDEYGNLIIDFKINNLHLMSYSIPVDTWLSLDELNKHLHSLPDLPNAIPYRTTYYTKEWGFCISHAQRNLLKDINYHVVIKSKFFKGQLDYGELIIKGEVEEEILLSTYICHPSMGNNEISGIVVTTALADILLKNKNRYTYRIIFIPETIGSIAYLSLHSSKMKQLTKAGFVISCVGDNLQYSYLPSRNGNTLADKVAKYSLKNYVNSYVEYSFLDRGSDERQYCSPLIDLPVASIMRTKYGEYKEYHTSLDNLNFISEEGLYGALSIIYKTILILEYNYVYLPLIPCEPQLGKRGLYNITSNDKSDHLINILAHIDGKLDLLDVAITINADFFDCVKIVKTLLNAELLKQN